MNFKQGDKVIFTPEAKSYWAIYGEDHIHLQNDTIYTVRGWSTYPNCSGIYLEGVINDWYLGHELSYHPKNFRKVDDDNFAEEVLENVMEEIKKELVI